MSVRYWLRIKLKKIFVGKEKKAINVLTVFFIFRCQNFSKIDY